MPVMQNRLPIANNKLYSKNPIQIDTSNRANITEAQKVKPHPGSQAREVLITDQLAGNRALLDGSSSVCTVLWKFDGAGIEDYFGIYLGYVFVPGLLLLQVFVMFWGKGRRKKKRGCSGTSLIFCLAAVRG